MPGQAESDLWAFLMWRRHSDLDPLQAHRAHLELYLRWMQDISTHRPSTRCRRPPPVRRWAPGTARPPETAPPRLSSRAPRTGRTERWSPPAGGPVSPPRPWRRNQGRPQTGPAARQRWPASRGRGRPAGPAPRCVPRLGPPIREHGPDREAGSLRVSSVNRIARSRRSFGYFRGAAVCRPPSVDGVHQTRYTTVGTGPALEPVPSAPAGGALYLLVLNRRRCHVPIVSPRHSAGERLSVAYQARSRVRASTSWSTVGEPAKPSGVVYIRQARAETSPGRANGSIPSSRMVGEPVNPNRSASSLDSTACVRTRTCTPVRVEAARTRSIAVCQLGQPPKYSTVTSTLMTPSSPCHRTEFSAEGMLRSTGPSSEASGGWVMTRASGLSQPDASRMVFVVSRPGVGCAVPPGRRKPPGSSELLGA